MKNSNSLTLNTFCFQYLLIIFCWDSTSESKTENYNFTNTIVLSVICAKDHISSTLAQVKQNFNIQHMDQSQLENTERWSEKHYYILLQCSDWKTFAPGIQVDITLSCILMLVPWEAVAGKCRRWTVTNIDVNFIHVHRHAQFGFDEVGLI